VANSTWTYYRFRWDT